MTARASLPPAPELPGYTEGYTEPSPPRARARVIGRIERPDQSIMSFAIVSRAGARPLLSIARESPARKLGRMELRLEDLPELERAIAAMRAAAGSP